MDVLLGCISAKFNQTNTRIHKTYLPILGYIWMNYDNAPTWNGQLGIVNPNQPWFGSWHHSDLWAMVKNSKTRHASFASFGNIHKPVTYYMFSTTYELGCQTVFPDQCSDAQLLGADKIHSLLIWWNLRKSGTSKNITRASKYGTPCHLHTQRIRQLLINLINGISSSIYKWDTPRNGDLETRGINHLRSVGWSSKIVGMKDG